MDDEEVALRRPSPFDIIRGIELRAQNSEIDPAFARRRYEIDRDELMHKTLDRIAVSLETLLTRLADEDSKVNAA